MRKFCLIVFGCALLTAQELKQSPLVRSITVRLISTRALTPDPIDFTAITEAWKPGKSPSRLNELWMSRQSKPPKT